MNLEILDSHTDFAYFSTEVGILGCGVKHNKNRYQAVLFNYIYLHSLYCVLTHFRTLNQVMNYFLEGWANMIYIYRGHINVGHLAVSLFYLKSAFLFLQFPVSIFKQ